MKQRFYFLIFSLLLPSLVFSASLGLLVPATRKADSNVAYHWAMEDRQAGLLSFEGLTESLDQYNVLWWHELDSAELPPAAMEPATVDGLRRFIRDGGGLLLSGYAPQYVAELGLNSVPPTTVVHEPAETNEWGFQPQCSNHLIFSGLSSPVYTLEKGLEVENIIAWWDNPADFDGSWLADTENSIGKVAIGEIRYGLGKVIVVGGGAFDWSPGPEANSHHDTLVQLAGNMIDYLATPSSVPVEDPFLAARWDFEEETGNQGTTDLVSGQRDHIANNFDRPERYVLADGTHALVMDGYSTWIRRDSSCAPILHDKATWAAWFAPRSYPIQNAPFFQQISDDAGYSLEITKYGQWGLRLNIDGIWHALWAPDPLPRNTWNHIAAVYERSEGISLYLNGKCVSHQPVYLGYIRSARDEPFLVGKSASTGFVAEIFPLAVLNGLLDDARIYRRALSAEELQALALDESHAQDPGHLQLDADRFASDPHRPVYHALPESDWTNEPHGLVQMPDGRYHLFFQKNSAGPYWEFLHWGHVSSTDLIHWRNEPIALAPEPGYDQAGAWSGHAVEDDGELKLIYTGIDGRKAVMALAVAANETRDQFQKYSGNPIIASRPSGEPLMDFRDPFLWRESGLWHMIIGAGVPDVGGTALHYRSSAIEGPWEYTGHFYTGNKDETGFYWEMPIYIPFEKGRSLFGVTEMPAINEYWVGTHRDGRFIPNDARPRPLEVINHLLSPTPVRDNQGRWIAIGIIPETRSSQEQLDAGWAHLFSLPRVWRLHPERDILLQSPAEELQDMRSGYRQAMARDITANTWTELDGFAGTVGELKLEIAPGRAHVIEVAVRRSPDAREETVFRFELSRNEFTLDRTRSSLNAEVQRDIRKGRYPVIDERETLFLHVFLDNSVIEGFINEGHAFATRVYPTLSESSGFAVRADAEGARIIRAEYWDLKPSRSGPGEAGKD